jgi:hypothetical protein
MLLTIAVRILETMFALGLIGCALVFIFTSIEDVRMLFGKEHKRE